MLTEFGKIFVFLSVAVVFVIISVFAAKLIRPKRPSKEKLSTYECGENPQGSPWVKFNIRFFVVALIFLIFDVEVVMLFPWAVVYKEYSAFGLFAGLFFLIVLGLGMVYEWRKGDLDWDRPHKYPVTLKDIFPGKEDRTT